MVRPLRLKATKVVPQVLPVLLFPGIVSLIAGDGVGLAIAEEFL